jgi:hypothetical protein
VDILQIIKRDVNFLPKESIRQESQIGFFYLIVNKL